MKIEIGSSFIFRSENGISYQYDVVNINSFRDPNAKYAADVVEIETGLEIPDVIFFGDEWLYMFSVKIESVK